MLADAVGSDTFRTDIPADKSQAAAPHEIMSAVIGLNEYADFSLTQTRENYCEMYHRV